MSTTVDAIYEQGIEADDEIALAEEFAQWDAASVEDMQAIEQGHFALANLGNAYGDNEPEYPLDLIKEANPKYL